MQYLVATLVLKLKFGWILTGREQLGPVAVNSCVPQSFSATRDPCHLIHPQA